MAQWNSRAEGQLPDLLHANTGYAKHSLNIVHRGACCEQNPSECGAIHSVNIDVRSGLECIEGALKHRTAATDDHDAINTLLHLTQNV